ncbi:hypothetical protein BDV23DRAFT_184361 [Aspergillus alliaceus]|uniref:Uncharacterized protein n=1 Tax=Petromyces alliaceus TaxID=209559 RepID=A0A5N7C5V6_PETAA|nr:hypothetical protein BDV23DRAFT_184361 [Aspergillus alliaceus]
MDALKACSNKAVKQHGKRDWELTNTTEALITSQGLTNTKQSGESLLARGKPDQGLVQHRFNANCGETMVSLAYRMTHKETDKMRRLKPKSKIVAWEKAGAKGKIKPPCEYSKGNKEEDKCGYGWGCGAFTGKEGMDFDVTSEVKKDMISLSDPKFPKFEQHPVEFPRSRLRRPRGLLTARSTEV